MLSLICSFYEINRHKFYRRKDFTKRFCNDLKELPIEIINYEEKEMTILNDKKLLFMKAEKYVIYAKKSFVMKIKYDISHKVRDHCHFTGKFREAAHNIWNLRYKILKKVPVVFRNGSVYDYHFIIKQLAEDFKGRFECLGENTKKYITFSVPIKGDGNSKKIAYKLKFIDAIDLCKVNYQTLLITNLKLTKKNVRNVRENVNLLDLK